MNRKLFLFDIDGTLLSPRILPRQILNRAFQDIAGISPDLQFEDVAGLTDPLIITNGLRKLGIIDDDIIVNLSVMKKNGEIDYLIIKSIIYKSPGFWSRYKT